MSLVLLFLCPPLVSTHLLENKKIKKEEENKLNLWNKTHTGFYYIWQDFSFPVFVLVGHEWLNCLV